MRSGGVLRENVHHKKTTAIQNSSMSPFYNIQAMYK